jgi:hypothetical protein
VKYPNAERTSYCLLLGCLNSSRATGVFIQRATPQLTDISETKRSDNRNTCKQRQWHSSIRRDSAARGKRKTAPTKYLEPTGNGCGYIQIERLSLAPNAN